MVGELPSTENSKITFRITLVTQKESRKRPQVRFREDPYSLFQLPPTFRVRCKLP